MVFSIEHQLEMPDSFPANEMHRFIDAGRSILTVPIMSDTWKEFGLASNLIGYRFRACHEDMSKYIHSWNAYDADVLFEEIYLRENALFGMFTAGVSCIESTCYALNALASHPKLLNFKFGKDEQYKSTPNNLQVILSSYAKSNSLASVLDVLIKSKEWKEWVDLRNRMSHRSCLPRIIKGAIGSKPPPAKALEFSATLSTPALAEGVQHLEAMFTWLTNSLCDLLVEGEVFAN